MSYPFVSQEWVEAFAQAINRSESYREYAATWEHGPVALVVNAAPEVGWEEDRGVWLDLHRGRCRQARIVSRAEAEEAPFVIYGDYGQWRGLVEGKFDLLPALMRGRLKLKGDLKVIVKYVKAAKALIAAAQQVPTAFSSPP